MNVAVVGAGLAGLAAACELADLGHTVTVFEKRPFAGGKAYSFVEPRTGYTIDNGQHVFMRCTSAYVSFLRRLGTLHLTLRQERLRVPVYANNGLRSQLNAGHLPAPLHLLPSFALYQHLDLPSKWRITRLLMRISYMAEEERMGLFDEPFAVWLAHHGQLDGDISGFWDFLTLPTCNARCRQVSTADALFVVREGFLASARSAGLGIASTGLTEVHVEPALRFIESRHGTVRTRHAIARICLRGQDFRSLTTSDGSIYNFDACVCAVGPRQLPELLPRPLSDTEPFRSLRRLPMAPIINLHLWFDRPVAPFALAAFVGSDLQWVFNRRQLDRDREPTLEHLVLALSGAEEYLALNRKQLEERFVPLVRRALPKARQATLERFIAIKEPEATFVPAPGIHRPPNQTPVTNLVVAGAYTATGWPATMESAVRSGLSAARLLHLAKPPTAR